MDTIKRKGLAVATSRTLDKSSLKSNYTKSATPGKRFAKGFRVQITELEDVSSDASEVLLHALDDVGITDINYLPFNGIARVS